jgi:hypothetical protein
MVWQVLQALQAILAALNDNTTAVEISKAITMLSLCMPQEVRGCTQERRAAFIGTVKTLAGGLFSKVLASDMPFPTVTARKRIVPLTRRCFYVTLAKMATQLSCAFGVIGDGRDVCKGVFVIHSNFIGLQTLAWLSEVICLSLPLA